MNFGKGFSAGVIVLLQTLLTRAKTLEFVYNSHLTKPCINEVSFFTGQENSIGLSQWLLYHSRGDFSVLHLSS